jgi:hypothetical protein
MAAPLAPLLAPPLAPLAPREPRSQCLQNIPSRLHIQ